MNRERSPRRKKQAAVGDGLSLLVRRVARGEEVRALVEEAVDDKRVTNVSFWNMSGQVSGSKQKCIRQQVLADRADEAGISEADLGADLRLAEAVHPVRTHCGKEFVDALLSAVGRLTEEEVAWLKGMEPATIRKMLVLL